MRGILWSGLFCCCLLAAGCTMPSNTTNNYASTPVAAEQSDWGRLSLQLKPRMTEQDVIKVLGQPKYSDLQTCGGGTGYPWQCKIWVYGYPLGEGKGLRVYLEQAQPNTWLV